MSAGASAGSAVAEEVAAPGSPNALVVGGGPAGLATAIMLSQLGWKDVRVVDRLPPPAPPADAVYADAPERSYNLGVSGRGQKFLDSVGVLDKVRSFAAPNFGRMVWDEQGNESVTLRPEIAEEAYQAFCIQRDRLTAVLLEECARYGEISISHEVEVLAIDWPQGKSGGPAVRLSGGEGEVRPGLLVGADGFNSAVARALSDSEVSDLELKSWEDKNTRVYKTVPLDYDLDPKDPSSWKRDLNFSASSQDGADVTMEVLPTHEGKGVGVALYKPGNEAILDASTEEAARQLIERNFPQFADVIPRRAYAQFVQQRDQRLPVFQYAKNALHGPRTACLGDSIHTVKPYFGLGVNSAFEDVGVLRSCLESRDVKDPTGDGLGEALQAFTDAHRRNAETLVKMSRSFDGGFVFFVLPIILDSIFHKLLPSVFSTNSIRMLQKHDLPFEQAGAIKRKDRALQISLLSLVLLPAAALVLRALKWLMTG